MSSCVGWRRRVLLSRNMCLYNALDLSYIPTGRRTAALAQQVKLLSPFNAPGFYALWQGGKVRLWIWDQAALVARLPLAEKLLVLPDSALVQYAPFLTDQATPLNHGEGAYQDGIYIIAGISGQEKQHWQQGQLQDSEWQPAVTSQAVAIALEQAAPLQAADKRLLGHVSLAALAVLLLAVMLLQAGGAINLWQQHRSLTAKVQQQSEQNKGQQQAMRQALAAREQWLARQALLQQPGQLGYVQQLAKVLPSAASFWQEYRYEPGRLRVLLTDPEPDPRDYVRIISNLPNTRNVQVQLDASSQQVTIQAELTAPATISARSKEQS